MTKRLARASVIHSIAVLVGLVAAITCIICPYDTASARNLYVLVVEMSPEMNTSVSGRTGELRYLSSDEYGRSRIRKAIETIAAEVVTAGGEAAGLLFLGVRFPQKNGESYYGPFSIVHNQFVVVDPAGPKDNWITWHRYVSAIDSSLTDFEIPDWTSDKKKFSRKQRRSSLTNLQRTLAVAVAKHRMEDENVEISFALRSAGGLYRKRWIQFLGALSNLSGVQLSELWLQGSEYDLRSICRSITRGELTGWLCKRDKERALTLVVTPTVGRTYAYSQKGAATTVPVMRYQWENLSRYKKPPTFISTLAVSSSRGPECLVPSSEGHVEGGAPSPPGEELSTYVFQASVGDRTGVLKMPVKGCLQQIEVRHSIIWGKRVKRLEVFPTVASYFQECDLSSPDCEAGYAYDIQPENILTISDELLLDGQNLEADRLLGRRLGVLGSQLTAGDWNFISPVRMNLSVSGTGTGFYSAGFDDGVLFASLSADRSIDIYIQRVGIVDRRVELDSELRLTFDPDEVQVSYLGTADAAQKYRHERNENTLRWWWTVIADIPRVNLESKIMLGKVSWHLSTGIEKTWATLRTDLKALGSRSIPTIRISGDTVSGSSFDAHTGVFFDDAFSVSEVYSPSPENTVAVRIRPDPHISAGRHDFLLKLEPVNYPAVRITSDTYVDFVITRDKPSYLRLGFLQEEVELEARLLCDGNCNRDSDRLELPVVLEHPEWIDLSEFGGVIRLDSIVLDGEEHSIGCTPYSFAASDGTEVPVGCEDGYPTFAVQMTRGLLGTLSIDRTAFDSAWAVGEYRIFFGLDVGTPLRNEPLPVMTQLADRSTVDHLRFESPTRKRNLALGLILGILLVICGYVLVRFRRFSAIEQRYNIARREIGAVQIELEQHILLLPARLEEQRCRIYSFKEYPDTLIKEVVELGNSLNASLAFGHSIALHIPEVATLEGARTREGTGWMTTVRWYKRSCQPWKAAVAAAYEAASNFIQFEEGFIRVMSEITSSNQALVGYASARLKLRMKLYQWVLSSHLFTVKRFLRRSSGFREQLRRRYAVGQFWLSGLDDQRQQDAFPGLYGKLVNYRITRMSRTHFIQPLNRVTTLLAHTCSGRVYFRYRSVALLVRIIDKIRPAG